MVVLIVVIIVIAAALQAVKVSIALKLLSASHWFETRFGRSPLSQEGRPELKTQPKPLEMTPFFRLSLAYRHLSSGTLSEDIAHV